MLVKKVMVKLENVTKDFGEKKIIKGIDLEIYEGEFLTLLGPSGCGKTTILRTISGLEEVTTGKIYIDNEEVTNLPPQKRDVNTIFQNFALFNTMTVQKNIEFGLKMKKLSNEEIKKRTNNIIEMIQMQDFINAKPNQLSGGQQQRVALARGLVNKPKVLLLDEPLSSLDLKLRKKMGIELKEIQNKTEITFIYVTHDQDEALSMSDRIAIINNGVIEQIATPKEIYNNPKTLFVADFIGESNKFKASVMMIKNNEAIVAIEDLDLILTIHDNSYKIGESLVAILRPEQLKIATTEKNTFTVKCKESIYNGNYTKVIGKLNKTDVSFIIYNNEEITKNSEIKLKYNPKDFIIVRSK